MGFEMGPIVWGLGRVANLEESYPQSDGIGEEKMADLFMTSLSSVVTEIETKVKEWKKGAEEIWQKATDIVSHLWFQYTPGDRSLCDHPSALRGLLLVLSEKEIRARGPELFNDAILSKNYAENIAYLMELGVPPYDDMGNHILVSLSTRWAADSRVEETIPLIHSVEVLQQGRMTPLLWAKLQGKEKMAQLLIEKGCSLEHEIQSYYGYRALNIVEQLGLGRTRLAEILVQEGYGLRPGENWNMVLEMALQKGAVGLVDYLCAQGRVELSSRHLEEAIRHQQLDMVRYLASKFEITEHGKWLAGLTGNRELINLVK